MATIFDTDVLFVVHPAGFTMHRAEGVSQHTLGDRDCVLAELGVHSMSCVVSEHWVHRHVSEAGGADRGGHGFDSVSFVCDGITYQMHARLCDQAMEWLDPLMRRADMQWLAPEADWLLRAREDGLYLWSRCGVTFLAECAAGVVQRVGLVLSESVPRIDAWMFRERRTGVPTCLDDAAIDLFGASTC